MDGFDDLLAPSRHVLEENPFEDPFAKRSNSPDPWSTPFAAQQSSSSDPYRSEFDQERSTTPTAEQYGTVDQDDLSASTSTSQSSIQGDPLDSAAQIADDDDDEPLGRPGPGSPRSPGFRESMGPAFSEIATIRPTEPEELEPSIPVPIEPHRPSTPTRETTTPTQASSLPSHHSKQLSNSGHSGSIPPSPSTSKPEWERSVVSPLAQSAQGSLNRSFAGLALGGEAIGGWGGSQDSWSNERSHTRLPTEDDSDDDKPILRSVKQPEHEDPTPKPTEAATPSRKVNGIQPVFSITVDDPQKVGDPIRSFTMYTVHTRTTSPLFQKSSFSVLRRYSDFLWLYETLSINNPGVVVPPVPEKNPFGRFDNHFVRQRRFALEKCIQKIANHPVLGKDTDLKMFLESDSFALDIKHRKAEIAHERGGLMASIGQTIAGPRFYETDEWFDRQKAYLDSLESQLRGLVKAIELVAKQRSELACATGEFAQTVGDLSLSDVGKQLSQSLAGLADVERKAQDLQSTQSEQDMITLMGTVDEYARLINSVRLAFNSRIRTYHAWKAADSDLLRVKQTHEKNRSQGRIPTDRLGYSLSHIAEAERRALDAKHEYDHVSKLIKSEVARFEQERIEDFKDSLHEFLEGMISRQKELIGAWENYQQLLLKKVGGGRGLQSISGPPLPSP